MSRRGGQQAEALAAAGAIVAGVLVVRHREQIGAALRKIGASIPGVHGLGAGALSPRRQRALAFLAEVIPAKYGAPGELGERFKKIAPNFRVEVVDGKATLFDGANKLPDNFTTCGYLPCAMGRALGDPRGISQCGLEQVRINAKKADAWVEAKPGAAPKPGDVLVLVDKGDVPLHVGVFVGKNADGSWKTADAGQGTHEAQEARYVDRSYDANAAGGPTLGGPAGARRLAGWLDLDKYPIHDVAGVSGGVAGVVVDVRHVREFNKGHVEGAINIPVDELHDPQQIKRLDKDRPIFTYCKSGIRSRRAAHVLEGLGFSVVNMGGWSG